MERLASVRIGSPMAPWCRVNPFPCAGTLPQRIVGYRGHWSAAKSLALLLDIALTQFVPVCRQEKRVVISVYTYYIPSHDSTSVLSYQELPTCIQCGQAMARRRKEDGRAGIASPFHGMRWGRFSSRVRHRVVPDRERGPDRCSSSGSAADICSDAPAGAQRAERAADGGMVYVLRALSVSSCAPRMHAQRGARCDPYNTRNCLPPKK